MEYVVKIFTSKIAFHWNFKNHLKSFLETYFPCKIQKSPIENLYDIRQKLAYSAQTSIHPNYRDAFNHPWNQLTIESPVNWDSFTQRVTINRVNSARADSFPVKFIINSWPCHRKVRATPRVGLAAIRGSGSWLPVKSFQFSQILRRTVYLFTFPCASWCTRYNGFTVPFPLSLSLVRACHRNTRRVYQIRTGDDRPRWNGSKLTPHFRKRIFCCSCTPAVVCARVASYGLAKLVFGGHACASREDQSRLQRGR